MHPVLVGLPSYGLMLALALLLGWSVMQSLGRRDHLPPGRMSTAYVLGAGFGLFGARLGWILSRPNDQAAQAELVAIHGDELAPFLGLMMGAVVSGLYLARRRIPIAAGYDVAAPALAAVAIVERLGALLAGTGYGRVAPELPWAIQFPAGSPAFLDHQRNLEGLLPVGAEHSLPVHPTQIYGMLLAGVTLAVALWLRKHRSFSGQVVLGTGIAHLVGRALIEDWFRADAGPAMAGPLSSGQLSAVVLIVALGVVMWARARLSARSPAAYRPWEGGRWSPRDGSAAGSSAASSSAGPGKSTVKTAGGGKPAAKAKHKGKGGKHKRRKKR
ncbi:MAG: prolipoprotein diacylglyceryl transferase [Myxococcales bacterium]|nr:prolipoprotein diacylglyceryl transferase [Myxococcales bacterium]MCB9712600.1 prolipoprotein diacylglyceryl transferase [Myxococcales bacterium]